VLASRAASRSSSGSADYFLPLFFLRASRSRLR
jgi:hypothetical protein